MQISPSHPLKKLLTYARAYRRDFRIAAMYSVLNKFFDILPEVLIGAAVDVVIKGDQSFLAQRVGLRRHYQYLAPTVGAGRIERGDLGW